MMDKTITFILAICLVTPSLLATTGVFWHISDYHYDPRPESKRSCILNVSDAQVAGYGTAWCDSSWALVNSSIYAMRDIEPNPDFIVWTGDDTLHYTKTNVTGTQQEVVDIVIEISSLIDQLFPNIPVLASLGNHDYVPDDQVPDHTNDIYTNISRAWAGFGWFDNIREADESDTFDKYGYYAVTLPSGLIGLALNTNYYYNRNLLFQAGLGDPGNQFTFIDSLAVQARTQGRKMLITGHVSFGVGFQGYFYNYESFNELLVETIRRNSDVIIASFFGHEHSDVFKLVFDQGEPVSAALLAPSITPWRWREIAERHNPGVRLVKLNYTSGSVLDFTQYYFNFESASQGGSDEWSKLYTFTEQYGVKDASPQSLYNVAKLIQAGEKSRSYWSNVFVGGHNNQCDTVCGRELACAILNVGHSDLKQCREEITTNRAGLPFIHLSMWWMVYVTTLL